MNHAVLKELIQKEIKLSPVAAPMTQDKDVKTMTWKLSVNPHPTPHIPSLTCPLSSILTRPYYFIIFISIIL